MGTHTVGLNSYTLILLKKYIVILRNYTIVLFYMEKKKDVNYLRSREVE